MEKRRKTKVLIVGAGPETVNLIEYLTGRTDIRMIGVIDENPGSPGILLARRKKIPVGKRYKRFMTGGKIDKIMLFKGDKREIEKIKDKDTILVEPRCSEFIASIIDEYKSTNDKLRENENKYKTMFELSPAAIVLLDSRGKVTDVNGRLSEWLGFMPKEVISKSLKELPYLSASSKKIVTSKFKTRMKGREVRPYELEFIAKNGKKKVGIIYATAIEGGPDGLKKDLIVIDDVTDRKKMEDALKESQIKYKTLYDASSDAIMLLDPNGKFLEGNVATLNIFGFNKGKKFASATPVELSPRYQPDGALSSVKARKMIRKAMVQGSNFFEWTHKRKDGKEFLATVLLTRMEIQGRKLLQATVRDVTKKTKSENEIKRLKQQIEFILGATKTGVDIIDSEYNIRYIDPEWRKVYGDPRGKKCYEYFVKRRSVCPDCGIPLAFKKKRAVVSEAVLPRENNRRVQVTTIPFRDDNGEWMVAEVNIDLTERKKVEEEIERQKTLLNNIISNIPYFVFWKNKALVYLGCNENFAEVAGLKNADMIKGKTDYDLPWKKEEADYFRECDSKVIKTGVPMLDIEETQLQASGRNAILLTSRVPLRNTQGGIIGVIGIYTDITERKTAEKVLKHSEAKYRTIFENTGAATIILEEDMMISMVNDEFEKLSGYPRKEIEDKKSFLEFVEEEFVDATTGFHHLRMVDPESAPRNYEIKCVGRDGKISDIYLTVAVIPGTKRSVVSLLDITELRRKEIELNKQKELLNNTNKALEQKLRELQEATGHIKKLEGLVPICVNCKKMRVEDKDPSDRGSWVPLEKYISERSNASFTHGLCPECIKTLYGRKLKGKKPSRKK